MSEHRSMPSSAVGSWLNLLVSLFAVGGGVVAYVSWGSKITTLVDQHDRQIKELQADSKMEMKEKLLKDADQDASIKVIVTEIGGMKDSVKDMKTSVDKIADKVGAK